ncbi:MAG: acetate--CoA ligase [Candidatus Bathyarchaeia archaeon]
MLENFFTPSSVAVIGASREPGKVGHTIIRNIVNSGYKGKIFPVNPKADKILNLECYPSVLKIPENVDLGVITVPSFLVPQVVEECGEKGIKSLVVISAGFKEIGPEGATLERQLLNISRKYNIRILGPNCLGIVDTYTPLNATFAAETPLKGNIAFISQSGALCIAVLDWSLTENIGFSRFVSLGNKSDLDEADFMQAIADDPNTNVILVYIESVGNGEKFIKVAKQVTRKKPVIILKSGVSEAGARAASSHTGALAGRDIAFETAFKQTGIIRARSVEELFDLAETFSTQPIPEGPNVVIITNAGGPGILATDACDKYGLKLAPINSELLIKLSSGLPPTAGLHNPIDVIGDATPERYGFALSNVMDYKEAHSVVTLLTRQAMTEPERIAEFIVNMREKYPTKPILAVFMGGEKVKDAIKILAKARIPNFPFPERAIYALAEITKYGEYLRTRVEEEIPKFSVNTTTVREILNNVRAERRVNLLGVEAKSVLSAYGVPTPPSNLAKTKEEAVRLAEEIGYPVVLKVASPQILHKTDIGGIKLNLNTPADVAGGFDEIIENVNRYTPTATVYGIEVQKMVKEGKEMIIGMSRDPQFGPMIMFGLGGIYVNFLKDVSFRLAPLTRKDASEMVFETKAATLLRGIRGEKPSDIDSIIDVLLRISQLVTEFPEINELDLNPLFVYEKGKGSLALDVKITIAP